LVVTAVTGLISVGDVVSGTGITAGTTITEQVSGTAGGAGTYQLDHSNTANAATCTCFGSVVKVTTNTAGIISIGDVIAGGAGFPTGATIETQVSGTMSGVGVYTISEHGTAYTASASGVTTFGTVLNVTAIGSGALKPGMPVSVPATAVIVEQLTGTAYGIGTYLVSVADTQYRASGTVTATGGVLTTWKAGQAASVGEITTITR
jgi:hypothetical protein